MCSSDLDEKMRELPSMADERRQRILWLGREIAAHGKWLVWDEEMGMFSVTKQYESEDGSKLSEKDGDRTVIKAEVSQ